MELMPAVGVVVAFWVTSGASRRSDVKEGSRVRLGWWFVVGLSGSCLCRGRESLLGSGRGPLCGRLALGVLLN